MNADLAEQTAAHMTHHFPTDTHLGGWEVARNTTTGTAGFVGEARTDRSVFTDDRQPDGYAVWLHITDRSKPPATA